MSPLITARLVGAACSAKLIEPVEANEVFARLGEDGKARLRSQGFEFYDWGARGSGEARFVCSWSTTEDDVEALVSLLRAG